MHHADSIWSLLWRIWRDRRYLAGVLNTNNIAAISEKVGDRMLLMGELILLLTGRCHRGERKETRRACQEYGNLKGYGQGSLTADQERFILM